MTKDTETADAKPAEPRRVEKIDFTKPFAVIFHQTESRNHFEIVTGKDCVAEAEKIAAGMALNQGRTVAVFGPQAKVKVPPAEPQADDLELNF